MLLGDEKKDQPAEYTKQETKRNFERMQYNALEKSKKY